MKMVHVHVVTISEYKIFALWANTRYQQKIVGTCMYIYSADDLVPKSNDLYRIREVHSDLYTNS